MQVTIFGASGQVGRLVVNEALDRGYKVVAFVHSQDLPKRKNLSVIKGDIYDSRDVSSAVDGSDAVISALGSWGTDKKDILVSGMRNIIPAMNEHKVKRIISLTGHGANAPGDKSDPLHSLSRLILLLLAPKILWDGEKHIELLNNSRLDWTVIRSPVMINLGKSKHFTISSKRPAPLATIQRQAVAICLVNLIESNQHSAQAPFIRRSAS